MNEKRVFVTVGTTKFDKLIESVTQKKVLRILIKLGYTNIQLQIGDGQLIEKTHPNITIEYNKYFSNFHEEINKADLVISHAGAGTCLEVLKMGKPLIVVINEDLMDNHQLELARELFVNNYLLYCTCSSLKNALRKQLPFKLYPEPNKLLFSDYLNKVMGFVN